MKPLKNAKTSCVPCVVKDLTIFVKIIEIFLETQFPLMATCLDQGKESVAKARKVVEDPSFSCKGAGSYTISS